MKLKAFTLVEMVGVMVMASAFSIGLYFIFLSSAKNISQEEVLNDIKNYATSSLEIISNKIRNADEISINTVLGSSIITVTNSNDDSNEEFTYNVINNIIYENSNPMKLNGFKWIDDQELYEVNLQMVCKKNNLTFFETDNSDLNEHTYDLDIIVNIQSRLDADFKTKYNAFNRIFAINKFSQLIQI